MRVKICGITNLHDARVAADAGADFVGLIRAASPRQVEPDVACAVVRSLPAATRPVLLYRDAPIEQIVAEVAVSGCRWVQLHGREPADMIAVLRRQLRDLHVIRAWEVMGLEAAEALSAYLDEAERAARAADHARAGRVAPGEASSGTEPGDAGQVSNLASVPRGGLPDVLILDAPKGGAHPGYDVLGAVSRRLVEWLAKRRDSSGAVGGTEGVRAADNQEDGRAAGRQGGGRTAEDVPEVWCAGGLTPKNVAKAVVLGRYAGVDVASGVESSPGRKDPGAVRTFITAARGLTPQRRAEP